MKLIMKIVDDSSGLEVSTMIACKTAEGAGLLDTGGVLEYTYNLLKAEMESKIKEERSEDNIQR